MITNPGTVRRLKEVAALHIRSGKDSSNEVGTLFMAVWALVMAKDFSALFHR
jgi:hypothetical protein